MHHQAIQLFLLRVTILWMIGRDSWPTKSFVVHGTAGRDHDHPLLVITIEVTIEAAITAHLLQEGLDTVHQLGIGIRLLKLKGEHLRLRLEDRERHLVHHQQEGPKL